MKTLLTLFTLLFVSVQSVHSAQNIDLGIPVKDEEMVQVPGPLGSIPYAEGDPCPDIPFCCPGPGNYPTAPCHGTGCALTVAAMAVPIILIAGVAAVILITSQPKNP